jgi:protocatechuate 3,4-dioxygenase beta subunit
MKLEIIRRSFLYYFVGVCLFSCSAWAFIIDTEESNSKHFKGCIPTQSIDVANEPKIIIPNNNLTNKVGALSDKLTPKIILIGRVRDKNCIAISNAAISMWQTDQYGLYRYIRSIDTHDSIYEMNNHILSKFQGVGSATSTNTGEFGFITVHPYQSKKNIGNPINLVITHDDFPDLKTKIFLVDKNFKVPNTHYVSANNTGKVVADGVKVYYFDIVLDGKTKHLSY